MIVLGSGCGGQVAFGLKLPLLSAAARSQLPVRKLDVGRVRRRSPLALRVPSPKVTFFVNRSPPKGMLSPCAKLRSIQAHQPPHGSGIGRKLHQKVVVLVLTAHSQLAVSSRRSGHEQCAKRFERATWHGTRDFP